MSDDEVAYWDREAIDDPRYARANWGMTSDDDGAATIKLITDIVQAVIPHRMARVLEIGCGPCRLLLPLAKANQDAEFYGIDISPEMLWIANRRIAATPSTKNIRVSHPQPHLGMDVVYCVELMQHLDDDTASGVLRDAWQAMRRGSTLVVQFVVRGEPGPHSFPRDEDQIRELFDFEDAIWSPLTFVQAAHPDWVFVTTSKR